MAEMHPLDKHPEAAPPTVEPVEADVLALPLPVPEAATAEAGIEPHGRFRRAMAAVRGVGNVAVRGSQAFMVGIEVIPGVNEGLTYGVLAASMGTGHNPVTSGLLFGAASYALEAGGAIAAAPLLDTPLGDKTSTKLHNFVYKNRKDQDSEVMSKPAKVISTVYFGSVYAMGVEKLEDPTISKAESRRFGLRTSAWLAGVCAVEGAGIAEGVHFAVQDPSVALPLVATGAAGWAANKVRKNHKKAQQVQTEVSDRLLQREAIVPRYDLSAEELSELEQELVSEVRLAEPGKKIVGVWLNPKSKFANFIRTHEASYFKEVQEVSEEDDANTLFFALVDTRAEEGRIVHGSTVTGVRYNPATKQVVTGEGFDGDNTGMYTVDSLIELGNFTAEEFDQFYKAKGIDVKTSIAVETNFRIGERAKKYHGFGSSELAYLALFDLLEATGAEKGKSAVFASINRASRISFDRVGMDYAPLLGRTDLVTEESLQGVDSMPIAMPNTATNRRLFVKMKLLGARVPTMCV